MGVVILPKILRGFPHSNQPHNLNKQRKRAYCGALSAEGFLNSDRFTVITYRPLNAVVIPLFILLEIEEGFKPNSLAA